MAKKKKASALESSYVESQSRMIWRKFHNHKLAMFGLVVLIILYILGIFSEFFAPQDLAKRSTASISRAPSKIHFVEDDGTFHMIPFVYKMEMKEDPVTWAKTYEEDHTQLVQLEFFYHGDPYKLLGFIPGDVHFFGTPEEDCYFLFGTDLSGRCIFSRILSALRISLTTGLVGVFFTFVLGCIFGGLSGFYGGIVDTVIQRIIEFLMSMPTIPLWMALAAAFPTTWTSLQKYFAITIILSIVGWTGLARVVRGKLLELREEDFVTAARVSGASDFYIIRKHLLPSFASYLIVNVTMAIPSMILSETSLSFLGIGLAAPIVSLGVMLKDANDISKIALYPWMMIPCLFVIIAVLAFNFVGDGLRDAADPYK